MPKRNLVSTVQIALQSGHLKIAEELALAETLRKELSSFRIKVNISTAHDSNEAWREGDHDDLVLATALDCWKAAAGGEGVRFLMGSGLGARGGA